MPNFIADFHIHSRFSRACSSALTVPELAKWAKIKGIGVLGTGDFTHPIWREELKDQLRDTGDGLYEHAGVKFLLTAEVNTLFYKGGKCHQVHQLLFAPSFAAAERMIRELEAFGSLASDGRPMLRLEPRRLVEIARGADARSLVVPAHAWTPWFGIFGSATGFDLIEECFEDQAQHIIALETGLSSDPSMNWRLSRLSRYAIISSSDAHSARKLGREATVFGGPMTYDGIMDALRTKDKTKLLSTIEFFPEEGKYHYDGHRACGIRWAPEETKRHGAMCTVCGRKVTVGVMHRVDALADRPDGVTPPEGIPFKRIVPLEEIVAEALDAGVGTKKVDREYFQLIERCGSEFAALLDASEDDLRRATTERIAEGILRVRHGALRVEPGYDGEFGTVRIFGGESAGVSAKGDEQLTLFS